MTRMRAHSHPGCAKYSSARKLRFEGESKSPPSLKLLSPGATGSKKSPPKSRLMPPRHSLKRPRPTPLFTPSRSVSTVALGSLAGGAELTLEATDDALADAAGVGATHEPVAVAVEQTAWGVSEHTLELEVPTAGAPLPDALSPVDAVSADAFALAASCSSAVYGGGSGHCGIDVSSCSRLKTCTSNGCWCAALMKTCGATRK